MAFRKNRSLWAVFVLAMIFSATTAYALIEPNDFNPALRTFYYAVPNFAVAGASDVTAGTNGVLAKTTINSVAAPSITTFSAAEWPTRVRIILIDDNNDSTLTCASVIIVGTDQFNVKRTETITTISETAKFTSYAYRKLTSATGATCAGANNAADVLLLSNSAQVGIPHRLRLVGDVEMIGFSDASASNDIKTYTGGELDTAGAISLTYNVVDMTDAQLATAMADGDSLIIRLFLASPLP